MLLPIKWMSQYVDVNTDEKTLADKLTLTGSHVDSIIDNEKEVENVLTGKILEVERHPNADKLVVTKIDINRDEPVQIITGATNIKAGDIVPVALEGAKLPGGMILKKTNFRGLPSYGMMVSYEEFGFDDKVIPKEMRDGIAILDQDTPIGADAKEVMGLSGKVFDIEVTFNRPDCLNIIGMAREVAATLKTEFKFPDIEIKNEEGNIKDYFEEVVIDDRDLCSRFYAKVVKDVKIGQSPLWMQRALMDAGMRPINNIVDVTNYVMLELGQPLHAYDADKVKGRRLIARRAKTGETVVTIDQTERKLSEGMLIIADEDRPVGVAGVMGGFETEIGEETKCMVLESASFNPKSVRETSKKLGIRSEASARNEKCMHYKITEIASKRACQLIEMIGAGTIVGGYLEAGESEYIAPTVTLRPYRVTELLGAEIPVGDMLSSLNSLEIESRLDGEKIICKIPYFRSDIEQEADLIEEVGRLYGFENIVSQPLKGNIKKGQKSDKRQVEDDIRDISCSIGLCEITTYSFISPKSYNNICVDEDGELKKYIKILNPLGEDYSAMRTTLMSNMLDVIQRNANRGVDSAKLYEVGNVFVPKDLPVSELPYEKSKLCIGMYGKCDFYDMKGSIEYIMSKLGIKVELLAVKDNPTFHPGRTAGMYINRELIGIYGEVGNQVLQNYGIDDKVYLAEIDIEKIISYKNTERKYKPLPKYPSMVRDIAVKVKDEILVGDMEAVIQAVNPYIIESVKLFDVYKGEHIEAGYKSTAFSVTYRNKDRTLKEREVESIHKRVLSELESKFEATLR